jgi:hypothetical protein
VKAKLKISAKLLILKEENGFFLPKNKNPQSFAAAGVEYFFTTYCCLLSQADDRSV